MVTLAHALIYGRGVEPNITKAIEWATKAAALNHPEASFHIGLAHLVRGDGIRNIGEYKYSPLRRSRKQGHPRGGSFGISYLKLNERYDEFWTGRRLIALMMLQGARCISEWGWDERF